MDRRLHRRRPRRGQRDVGCRENVVGLSFDDGGVAGTGEQTVVEVRRASDHELRPCDARPNQFCRRQQIRQDSIHFIRPAAGQQRDRRLRGCQAEPAQKAFASLASLREIDERMADELHWHPAISIDLLLERKNHEHKIGNRANGFQASGAPGPDLGADVINDRHAEPFEVSCERKVEVGEIDRDERVGRLGAGRRGELPKRRPRSRDNHDRLGQAGNRQPAVIGDQASARGRQLRSAEAGDVDAGVDRPQLARKRAGVQIAGRLAARHHETRQGSGRLKREGSNGSLKTMLVTFRSRTGLPPRTTFARKATWMPSTAR